MKPQGNGVDRAAEYLRGFAMATALPSDEAQRLSVGVREAVDRVLQRVIPVAGRDLYARDGRCFGSKSAEQSPPTAASSALVQQRISRQPVEPQPSTLPLRDLGEAAPSSCENIR